MTCDAHHFAERFPTSGDAARELVRSAVELGQFLSDDQRTIVAAQAATMRQGARTDLSPTGGMSQAAAAKLLNVSRRSLQRAASLIRDDAELAEQVYRGRISLGAALATVQAARARQREAPPPRGDVDTSDTELYARLGLDLSASLEDVKAAQRRLTLNLHPDRFEGKSADEKAGAHDSLADINAAADEIRRRRATDAQDDAPAWEAKAQPAKPSEPQSMHRPPPHAGRSHAPANGGDVDPDLVAKLERLVQHATFSLQLAKGGRPDDARAHMQAALHHYAEADYAEAAE